MSVNSRFGAIVLLMWCLGMGTGCGRAPSVEPGAVGGDKKDGAVPVEVAPVRLGEIEATVRSAYYLEAEENVKVLSRTSNRVVKLLVEEGDRVESGQLLAQLEDGIQRTQFEKAQVRVDKAREEYTRQKSLFDQSLISEEVYKNAQFELRQLELALEDARRDLDYTQVRAPISGTIAARLVNLGDLVSLNQHLFDLVDMSSLVARIYVPEQEMPRIAVGQPARVVSTAAGDQVFDGFVKRIAPVVESRSGTVKVTVGFHDVAGLRPGMYVTVDIVTAKRPDAILIPKRAIVYDGEQMFVFRLKDGDVVERVRLAPNLVEEENVEPVSGFAVGDLIVVAGQSGLKDGARVRVLVTGEADVPSLGNTGETAGRE
ncbi:MAG: efflux RND transporter periplasmic adaptor subunit [Verrucomicrobia bacterium]|nr:efflux RND transporter periplasmic adaptor subunit [Verrucomicrobiota bacterium]